MKKTIKNIVICLGLAAVTVAACSFRTSPIYAFLYGDFGGNHVADAMTVGKYWLQGMVPYRDLFLMGGPLYFLIQALGWLIGERVGILVLQIIGLSVTLFVLHEIGQKFLPGLWSWILLIGLAIPYAAMACGGDSTAEWCLPFMAAGLWLVMKNAGIFAEWQQEEARQQRQEAQAQNGADEAGTCVQLENEAQATIKTASVARADVDALFMQASGLDSLLMGLMAGCLLCIDWRFSVIYLAALVWSIVVGKNTRGSLLILIGLLIPCCIFGVYFAATGSLSAMLKGTFVFQAKWLVVSMGSMALIAHKVIKCCVYVPAVIAAVLLRKFGQKKFSSLMICMTAAGFVLGMCGEAYWYSYLPAILLIYLGLLIMAVDLESSAMKVLFMAGCLVVFVDCVIPLKSMITYLTDGLDKAYTEFTTDLEANMAEDENLTFLSLDMDSTFALMENIKPSTRYFAQQTYLSSFDSSILEQMDAAIAGAVPADILLITEKGYIGRDLDLYTMIQVYLKKGGSIFIYVANDEV